ncbi:MAG: nicotinate (nicotinamide) nucleotide adenylyltransferase, partial [Oscillospiraceae bacterium]|nr:nicotinate (nicotinamide) nucleotide adenylyltransferase [Oscillospiraceae bacterium]
MERIGIYGGTYSPPHIGHIRAAEYAIETCKLDRLLLIPTGVSPHKAMAAGASSEDRLHMLELSARQIRGAEVSDMEIRREGSSYTVDTLRALKGAYPDSELVLLMGTDMFLSFLSWREPEAIMKLATLAVFCRGEKGEKARVSDIELRREGRSYTVDTLRSVREAHPGAELVLLMGTDMFLSFLTWREPEAILEVAALAVFFRGER